MTKNEAIQELLDVVPVLNFCSRPHLPRVYKARRQVGGDDAQNTIKKGAPVELNIHHYVTIFLIDILGRDGKPCRRTELRALFLWKWPRQVSTFEGMVMKRLRAIEVIHQDSAEYPSNEKLVTFTPTGKRILHKLQAEREQQIDSMLSGLKIKNRKHYDNIVQAAQQLANKLWMQARQDTSSQRPKRAKRKRGKKTTKRSQR